MKVIVNLNLRKKLFLSMPFLSTIFFGWNDHPSTYDRISLNSSKTIVRKHMIVLKIDIFIKIDYPLTYDRILRNSSKTIVRKHVIVKEIAKFNKIDHPST